MAIRERRLFTVEEYEAMWRAGVFSGDDRIELLDGEILQKPRMNPPHASCTKRFNRLFSARLSDRALVSVQDAIRLPPRSEPEPDVALLRLTDDMYATRHPGPQDVYLVVEVADASLRRDRMIKLARYAAAGVAETWIVDLESRRIEVYGEPSPDGYRVTFAVDPGRSISAEAFPDVSFEVDDLVP